MNDLSPETNQLLGLARSAEGLTEARRSRIKAGVFTQLVAVGLVAQVGVSSIGVSAAAASGAGATASAGAAVGKVAWFSGSVAKFVSALALVSVTGAGAYVATRAAQAPKQAELAVVAPRAVAPAAAAQPAGSAAVAASEAEVEPAPALPLASAAAADKPVVSSARAASAAPAAVNAETLADETRLLRGADQALRAGDAARALGLLDEHASRYPRGVLAPERSAERLMARCKLGQANAKAAEAYLATHVNSAFAARIRDACAVR